VAVDLGGSFSVYIDVEEWVTISPNNAVMDPDNGAIAPTPTVSVVYYLATKNGGNTGGTITFCGATTSWSGTLSGETEITPSISFNAHAGGNYNKEDGTSGGPYGTLIDGSVDLTIAWDPSASIGAISAPNTSVSQSADSANSSAIFSGSEISLSASANSGDNVVLGNGTGADARAWANVNGTIYPAKSYSLSGEIFSDDSRFASSGIPINLSKYSGDPSPTTTAGPSFGASYSQRQYSLDVDAYAITYGSIVTNYVTGPPIITGGENYQNLSANEYQPISASVDSAWCDANNEKAVMIYTVDADPPFQANETFYNNQIRLHGYSASALNLMLANPYNIDPASNTGHWQGAWLGGEGLGGGIETTASIPWSSTNATLLANIQSAVTALSFVGSGNCTVAAGTLSSGNGTVKLTFGGSFAGKEFPGISVSGSLTGGTVTAARTTQGAIAVGGIPAVTEVWTLTFTGVTSGSFTISVGAAALTWTQQRTTGSTGGIAFSGTAATMQANIQNALNALPLVGPGNSSVTITSASPDNGNGSGSAYGTVVFQGALADTVISQFGANYGGTGTVNPHISVDGGPSSSAMCTLALSGMSSGDSFSLVIGVGQPYFNMSSHRYLKFSKCLTTAASPQTRTLTINGKSWPVVFPINNYGDVIIDLCNPVTGGAYTDATDSILYPGDPNPTLSPPGGGTDGPLWGVTYVETFSVSGFGAGTFETWASIDLITAGDISGTFMTTWEPRFSSMPQYGPGWTFGDDGDSATSFNAAENRSAILVTDGRQSFEWAAQTVIFIQPPSGINSYSPGAYSIAGLANLINAGFVLNGGPVGEADNGGDNPYFAYWTVPSGWSASSALPATDCSDNLANGYLNNQLPAAWLYGDGVMYVPTATGGKFQTGIGVANPTTVPLQMLISSIDFYPGCGDVFGFGGSSASSHVVYLAASKVYRSQAWGILINGDTQAPLPYTAVLLLPTGGELQPAGMVVGAGVSDLAEGIYRTSGAGLDGIEIVSAGPIGEGGAVLYNSIGSTGNVKTTTLAGVVTVVEQTFQEQKLSRVAIKTLPSGPIPPGDPSGAGPGPCLQRSPDMGGPWS
jgi:hypothetical protein